MKLWVVEYGEHYGPHYTGSVWDSKEKAEADASRIKALVSPMAKNISAWDYADVVELELNAPANVGYGESPKK